jgi:hypothetical protein
VHGRDQRRQLGFLHVLQFVDEYRQRRLGLLRRRAGGFEQGLQVVLEVAVVGQAGLGVEVQSDLDVAVLELE